MRMPKSGRQYAWHQQNDKVGETYHQLIHRDSLQLHCQQSKVSLEQPPVMNPQIKTPTSAISRVQNGKPSTSTHDQSLLTLWCTGAQTERLC